MPGPQLGDGPLVAEEGGHSIVLAELQTQQDEPPVESTDQPANFESFDLNGTGTSGDALEAPQPIQNDLTLDLFATGQLPPKPERLPDNGNCHIIWPGERLTIDGTLVNGVIRTNKRHYEASIAPGSKTRWIFRLLYGAHSEVKDRRLVGQLVGRTVVPITTAKVTETAGV